MSAFERLGLPGRLGLRSSLRIKASVPLEIARPVLAFWILFRPLEDCAFMQTIRQQQTI